MDNALIAAAVEGLAISIKPKEAIALKTVGAYGQVVNVVMAVPLAIALGGPPTISEEPTPQPNFQSQAFQEIKKRSDQQIGRDAVEKAVTTGTMRPFVNTMDGNEFRRYRPDSRAYYDHGQQQMPLTLRALSLIR